jgi:uncharacterized protein with HEPN domain
MSEKRDIKLFIQDVFECIEKINKYVLDFHNGTELKNDSQAYEAVMMNFIIIGEAVKNIFEQVKESYPEIEWKEIMAMRNILVHEYWGINDTVVWGTIKKDLPELKEIITRIQNNLK